MKILIAAGGTAGHLFPAVRLAEEVELRKAGEILFITSSRRQDREILEEKGIPFIVIPVIGLQSRKIGHVLNFAVRLVAGAIKSLFVILWFRPSVVIGFGGYVSGPILGQAALLRIKTIIHEQNVYPGKTNRLLAPFVGRIAVSFPETVEYFKKFRSKITVTGNPLRKGLKKSRKTKGSFTPLDSKPREIQDVISRGKHLTGFTVLAMGGSQGSRTLNRLIPEAVELIGGDKKNTLEMIHISGNRDRDEVSRRYRDIGIKNRVFSFTKEMDKLYNECDFAIARAGATTVSELLYLGMPSILIPYPYGDAHQRFNAEVLQKMGAAILFEERALSVEKLRDAIMKLMDRHVLSDMSAAVKHHDNEDACNILMKVLYE